MKVGELKKAIIAKTNLICVFENAVYLDVHTV